jgi:hypothetical protein
MKLEQTHKYEEAVIAFLNIDGWSLTHTGDSMLPYDAIGYTPKGKKCVVEMKFRNKYYETKVIEKYKYDKLMELEDAVKLYYVFDPKGNYLFWLDSIENLEQSTLKMPATTYWDSNKKETKVYLLPESKASLAYMYTDNF